MAKSNSSSSRRKKQSKLQQKVNNFSQGIGLSPLRIIVSGLLLLGVGYVIYAVAFSDRDDEKVVKNLSGLKLQQQKLDIDQRLQEMKEKKVPPKQSFLVTIEEASKMNDELDSIESAGDLSEKQKFMVDRIRMRNKSVIVMLMTRNDVKCDIERADLFRYCEKQLNSKDSENQLEAKYWFCLVPAVDLAQAPTNEKLENFVSAVETYPEGYINSPEFSRMLSTTFLKMRKEIPNSEEYWKSAYSVLSDQFGKSENQQVRNIGLRLESLKVFGQFELATLADRILWGDPSGPEDLEGAIAVLAQNPEANLATWVTIIKAYESFLSTDKLEETGSAWQKISELSMNIADADMKKKIDNILARQRKRAMSIGTKFDPTGTMLPDGRPYQLGDNQYTAVVFCDRTVGSTKALAKLGTANKDRQFRYSPVLAFVNELTQVDIDSLKKVPDRIMVTDYETSKRYYASLPIDFFPYIILLDKSGTIVSANLAVEQIPTRIAKFSAIERRKEMSAEKP